MPVAVLMISSLVNTQIIRDQKDSPVMNEGSRWDVSKNSTLAGFLVYLPHSWWFSLKPSNLNRPLKSKVQHSMCPCPQSLIHGKCCHFSMRNHGTMLSFPCLYTLILFFQCCNIHAGNQSDIAVEKKSGLLQFNDSNHLFKTKTVWTFPLSKYIPQIFSWISLNKKYIHPHPHTPPPNIRHPVDPSVPQESNGSTCRWLVPFSLSGSDV